MILRTFILLFDNRLLKRNSWTTRLLAARPSDLAKLPLACLPCAPLPLFRETGSAKRVTELRERIPAREGFSGMVWWGALSTGLRAPSLFQYALIKR